MAGGNANWLTTTDGDNYYFAHLDAWKGDSRVVGCGEVVGYVGSAGNARGDHPHIESHLGGQPANLYPAIAGRQRAIWAVLQSRPRRARATVTRYLCRLGLPRPFTLRGSRVHATACAQH